MRAVLKTNALLICCFLTGVLIVVILFEGTINEVHANGFKRKFYPHPTKAFRKFALGSDSFYIAGSDSQHIYLSKYHNPHDLLEVDINAEHVSKRVVDIPALIHYAAITPVVSIDSSLLHLYDGMSPAILSGEAITSTIKANLGDTLFFNKCIWVSGSSFVLRIYNNRLRQNILVRVDLSHALSYTNKFILNKQVDGVFCTDGTLQYNARYHKVIYTYQFQNSIVLLDTNLRLYKSFHTIDTNTLAKIKVSYTAERRKSMASPPSYSSKISYASEDRIYVISGFRADNDDSFFQTSTVIDVYSLGEARYLFSFYLPDYKHHKISTFAVKGNRLYAVQGETLCYYELNFTDLPS